MVSIYSPRWTEPEQPATRCCDIPGCMHVGEYRAPKHRKSSESKDYHWFCLDHVKDYNQQWNYFAGMQENEMEQFWREAQTGERPTWKRDGRRNKRYTRENLSDAVRQSFADYLANGKAGSTGTQRIIPIDRATQKALAVLDLEWPITEKEVKQRYKVLVKQYHPDVNATKEAEDYFKKITQAYQHLKEAVKQLVSAG